MACQGEVKLCSKLRTYKPTPFGDSQSDGDEGVQSIRQDLLRQRDTELREWRRDDWNPGLFSVEKTNVDLRALGGRS